MTWAEFNTTVRTFLHSYNRMVGVQSLIDLTIKAALKDLMSGLTSVRPASTRVVPASAFYEDGLAARIRLPLGSMVLQLSATDAANDENVSDFQILPQSNLDDMKAGRVDPQSRYACYIPATGELWIFPKPSTDDSQLLVRYESQYLDYEDDDEVPFDLDIAEAVSEYVLEKLATKVDHDAQAAQIHRGNYTSQKRTLLSDSMEAARVPNRRYP